MSDKKMSGSFLLYIKKNRKGIIFYVFSVIFLTFILLLESVKLESILYAILVISFMGLMAAVIDFMRFYQKVRYLHFDTIPERYNVWEAEFVRLIEKERQKLMHLNSKNEVQKKEMMDFYTMWVHQIKTPIAAMNLILQDEELFSDEQRNELEGELFKIEQYVEMVLSYLRMESETTDYVIKKCQLEPLVRQAVRKFAKQFIRKKIRIELWDLDREIITDEKWFSFVLEQLLSNSLKYTNRGTISIYMQENSLIIEDTGIGIEESDLPRIFEKGFTGYNGRVEQKSTGLGLYLCKTILHKIGFSIYAKSVKGKGTKMIIDMERPEIVVE